MPFMDNDLGSSIPVRPEIGLMDRFSPSNKLGIYESILPRLY